MASGRDGMPIDVTERGRPRRVTWDLAEVAERHGGEDPVPRRPGGGQALLQPRDERRERGEGRVRVRGVGVLRRRERAAQPPRRRQARAHQAGVGGPQAPGQRLEERPPDPAAAEERRRRVPRPGLVSDCFLVLVAHMHMQMHGKRNFRKCS